MTIEGSLFGMAYGDALGKNTEFASVAEIQRRYGPEGPSDLPEPALVTDDTQMALAVGEGLVEVLDGPFTAETLAPVWSRRFVEWAHSPDNNRAPGMTCLRACGGLAEGEPWVRATLPGSKGCGANMRVTGELWKRSYELACRETGRLTVCQRSLELRRSRPRGRGDAVHQADRGSAESFMVRGWDECLGVLDRLDAALQIGDRESDPCQATGEDSIAALAGAFAGAAYGIDAFPAGWRERIEYADRLDAVATGIAARSLSSLE